ncbi:MAG: hypothetical protein AAFQ47_11365 [Pseudomonadota bacterium]
MTKVAIFFVVQGVGLQAQGLLLASSLRAHLGDKVDLIAYIPDGAMPSEAVCAAYASLRVDLRAFEVPKTAWAKPYPHGNKILAATQPRDADIHVFLDTDMVCVAPIDFKGIMAPGKVTVVPEGIPSWGKTGDRWDRAYAHFDLPMPTERVRLTRRKRREFLPYFNAGLVAFHDSYDGRNFAELWYETARDFDVNCAVGGKRPWLDQITLPLTMARFGIGYNVIPAEHNFSISGRPFEPNARPKILHYHRMRYGADWPQFTAEMTRMIDWLGDTQISAFPPEVIEVWEGVAAAP